MKTLSETDPDDNAVISYLFKNWIEVEPNKNLVNYAKELINKESHNKNGRCLLIKYLITGNNGSLVNSILHGYARGYGESDLE